MEDNSENYFNEEPEVHRQGGSEQLIDFSSESREHEPVVKPSAPTAHDDNGYIVVPPTPQSSVDSVSDHADSHGHDEQQRQQEDINRVIEELSQSAARMSHSLGAVVAEADSSTDNNHAAGSATQTAKIAAQAPKDKSNACASSSSSTCTLCPYYLLGN
jgi:hypothetical protein